MTLLLFPNYIILLSENLHRASSVWKLLTHVGEKLKRRKYHDMCQLLMRTVAQWQLENQLKQNVPLYSCPSALFLFFCSCMDTHVMRQGGGETIDLAYLNWKALIQWVTLPNRSIVLQQSQDCSHCFYSSAKEYHRPHHRVGGWSPPHPHQERPAKERDATCQSLPVTHTL